MTAPTELYRVRSLSEYLRDALDAGGVAEPPSPVLLHVMTQVEYWAKQAVRTMALDNERPLATGEGRWFSPALLVIQVSPRPRSGLAERIILGRTPRADVCLPYPRISKHHAHFKPAEGGAYALVDQGSLNGTFVNGARLKEGEARVLPDDCIIFFGKYETRYMAPAVFKRHLEVLAGG